MKNNRLLTDSPWGHKQGLLRIKLVENYFPLYFSRRNTPFDGLYTLSGNFSTSFQTQPLTVLG